MQTTANAMNSDNFATNIATNIANAICRLRRRKGWDQATLAAAAGVSRTTLYHLERGDTRTPRTATLSRVARALETSIEELCDPQGSGRSAIVDTETSFQAFDRRTNPLVEVVADESPELFVGWTPTDWDELYSTFGVGGALTRAGVVTTATEMNRKREVIRRLNIVLETHLGEVAVRMVDSLFELVSPQSQTGKGDEA